jgi:pimeloyl-ACP methyl ester carboxylesterase
MLREIEIEAPGGRTFRASACGQPDAPLVLLLHGFPQTRYAWRHELPVLAEAGYFAVAPDQRGYSPGACPASIDAYSTDALVADVLSMADVLGATRFHLVGHAWGGQVAWLLAAAHPERVITLSVLSRPHPAAFREALRSDGAQGERSSHHRTFLDPAMTERLLEDGARRVRRALAGQGVSALDIDAYLEVLGGRDALDAALHWYRAASRSRGDTESGLAAADVPAIRVPTLYLWGDADATVGRAAAEATARYVSAPYRFVVVPGAGHFLTDQAPKAVPEAIRDWILESRAKPAS